MPTEETKEVFKWIEDGLSPLEEAARKQIAKDLWLMYPSKETLDSEPGMHPSDLNTALMMIYDLKSHGMTISELSKPWPSLDPYDKTTRNSQ